MRIILSAILLLTACAAVAQVDPDPDGVGIYFDEDATDTFEPVAPFTQFDVYLCLTRPSRGNGVSGFEIRVPDPLYMLRAGVAFDALGQELGTAPDFLHGFATNLPHADVIVLARLTYFNLDSAARREFFLSPTERPSIAGAACYADGADPRVLIPLHPSSGSWDLPVAAINGDEDVISNEDSAWGRVKSLYGNDGEVSP